ncbi:MAG TPA: aminotransferase class V-fold PLP-dependent enzyme, partial [Nitrososphaera sp.]|nr:aminotransferase class V-fold PLP-dependent enzyme [Nitrososphaera sp.]
MSETLDLQTIKKDFPVTRKVIYMNNGAIAPTPLSTIKAVADFMLKCAEAGPDAPQISEYSMSLLDEVRTRVAHLINCERGEVVLVQSTTEGINMVANGISWQKGDTIVVRGGRHEHYANYLPWVSLSQRKGVHLRDLPIDEDSGYFDMADLDKSIKGARMVAMSHALYNT